MSYNIEAAVYSYVILRTDEVQRITDAYLYGWTKVDYSEELVTPGPTRSVVVLRTSCKREVHDYEGARDEIAALCGSAYRYAENQIDRFASGLYPGKVCGSYAQAEQAVCDVHVNA